jgi:hypothetical protein
MIREVHVFVGPSLAGVDRPDCDGFVFHGPAAKGDVYRLVGKRPLAIGIIDGYFERVPAVWHKEILWALSQGIHVFGAASMGALRAAELAPFGMVGVGRVFDDFASGRLTDDDEVTIVHADSSLAYRPVSEAMVNLRATLARAEELGVLESTQASELVAHAKRQFYAERSYAALLPVARTLLGEPEWQRFAHWLKDPAQRVDRKQLDALELLRVLRVQQESPPAPKQVSWSFQHTDAWEQVRLGFARAESPAGERVASEAARPRRVPTTDREALSDQARLRAHEVRAARRDGYRPSERDIAVAARVFRTARGLEQDTHFEEFLNERGLSQVEFERLMAEEACVWRARLVPDYDLECEIADLEHLVGQVPRRPPAPALEESGPSLQALAPQRPEAVRLRVGP